MHYRITEWARYQHYKDRDPPWIKLHRDTLTSQTWVSLTDAGRVLAIACMLVAAGTDNKIPADPGFMRRRAYLNKDPDFAPLVEVGFLELVNDDNTVADASKSEQPQASGTKCSSETEERQRRAEEEERAFGEFTLAQKRNGRPEPTKLTDDRRKKLRARLDEHGLEGWRKMLDMSDASEFLNKTFPLKFDWVVEPKNFRKVIEGNYASNGASGAQKNGAARTGDSLPPAEPWEQRMYGWHKGKFWQSGWGPRPGEPGCRVPTHLIGGTA
jgi:hypothetical protein